MTDTGVIILVHGSRGERGAAEISQAFHRLSRGVSAFITPNVEIIGAALQFNQPDLEQAAAALVQKGAGRIIVVPYFLFPGRHITEDIPETIAGLERRHPRTRFLVTGNLGLEESFIDVLATRLLETAPDLAPERYLTPVAPGDIELKSLEIVARILPPLDVTPDELTIIKRIVHATGDRHIAPLVRFHPEAVAGALAAVRSGRPIFTDVRMLAAAISRRAASFGCAVHCALDEPEDPGTVRDPAMTRTAAAFQRLGHRLDGAIIAIGNAPTALLSVLDLIAAGKTLPAVVIGMPVGFVQASESKEQLMQLDVPYISIAGTRGGSPAAAAAINALFRLA